MTAQVSIVTLLRAAQEGSQPVIVRIVEPKEPGVADVLLGALGITGALILGAIVIGLLFGGVLFWIRARRSDS